VLLINHRFIPKYNYYAATVYNTLNIGSISWYVEGAMKTEEAINNAQGLLVNKNGTVLYTNAGWAKNKIGINASFKRTENFALRTSPNESALRGFTNWQPIIAVIRPQRVIARYTPASQDLSEQSYAVSTQYTPNDNYSINGSYTHINNLDGVKLYREVFIEGEIRKIKNTIIHAGTQILDYNQAVYQQDGTTFKSVTSFAEITYKFSEKKKVFFGTFQLIFLYLLIDYQYFFLISIRRIHPNSIHHSMVGMDHRLCKLVWNPTA
jgi:hypothetical protein